MEYADRKNSTGRDIIKLDEVGGYYSKHVMAMTSEKLHGKGDIAAELAWRDSVINNQQMEIVGLKLQLISAWAV